MGGSFAERLDTSTQEDLGNPSPDCTVRKHVSNTIRLYFEKHLVITQAHILYGLIKHKNLKHATKLLGFQDAKSRKAHVNVTENISKEFSKFVKSRKLNFWVAHRVITTVVVETSTSRQQIVETMSKLLHVLRKTLHKHTRFRVWEDENDEATCWDLITRNPHWDRILAVIILW